MEIRSVLEPLEFEESENGIGKAVGYAAVFGKRSLNLGGFREVIDNSAFNKSLSDGARSVAALWHHDRGSVLGRVSAGTLRLDVDERGLRYEIDLPDTTTGRDVAELLRRGDVTGSSFGFRKIRDDWSQDESGYPLRTLQEVALIEVSPTPFPAYPETDSALRSLAEHRSLDYSVVKEAAEHNSLRDLLQAVEGSHEEEGEEREEIIVVRRRFQHLV